MESSYVEDVCCLKIALIRLLVPLTRMCTPCCVLKFVMTVTDATTASNTTVRHSIANLLRILTLGFNYFLTTLSEERGTRLRPHSVDARKTNRAATRDGAMNLR